MNSIVPAGLPRGACPRTPRRYLCAYQKDSSMRPFLIVAADLGSLCVCGLRHCAQVGTVMPPIGVTSSLGTWLRAPPVGTVNAFGAGDVVSTPDQSGAQRFFFVTARLPFKAKAVGGGRSTLATEPLVCNVSDRPRPYDWCGMAGMA